MDPFTLSTYAHLQRYQHPAPVHSFEKSVAKNPSMDRPTTIQARNNERKIRLDGPWKNVAKLHDDGDVDFIGTLREIDERNNKITTYTVPRSDTPGPRV